MKYLSKLKKIIFQFYYTISYILKYKYWKLLYDFKEII